MKRRRCIQKYFQITWFSIRNQQFKDSNMWPDYWILSCLGDRSGTPEIKCNPGQLVLHTTTMEKYSSEICHRPAPKSSKSNQYTVLRFSLWLTELESYRSVLGSAQWKTTVDLFIIRDLDSTISIRSVTVLLSKFRIQGDPNLQLDPLSDYMTHNKAANWLVSARMTTAESDSSVSQTSSGSQKREIRRSNDDMRIEGV